MPEVVQAMLASSVVFGLVGVAIGWWLRGFTLTDRPDVPAPLEPVPPQPIPAPHLQPVSRQIDLVLDRDGPIIRTIRVPRNSPHIFFNGHRWDKFDTQDGHDVYAPCERLTPRERRLMGA